MKDSTKVGVVVILFFLVLAALNVPGNLRSSQSSPTAGDAVEISVELGAPGLPARLFPYNAAAQRPFSGTPAPASIATGRTSPSSAAPEPSGNGGTRATKPTRDEPGITYNRTMWSVPSDFNPVDFCSQFSEAAFAPSKRPRIFYLILFNTEFDMLEMVLQEAYPVVDEFLVIESNVSHALTVKPLLFQNATLESRFAPFLDKMFPFYMEVSEKRKRRFKSGWEIERRQRQFGTYAAMQRNISEGDIFITNGDMDEIFSATYLMRMKYCRVAHLFFSQFQFRYYFSCMQANVRVLIWSGAMKWEKAELRALDLYQRRRKRTNIFFNASNFTNEVRAHHGYLSWHFSTFGTLEQKLHKMMNSPHRFLSLVSREKVEREVARCEYANDTTRVAVSPDIAPYFMRNNWEAFTKKGWILPPQEIH